MFSHFELFGEGIKHNPPFEEEEACSAFDGGEENGSRAPFVQNVALSPEEAAFGKDDGKKVLNFLAPRLKERRGIHVTCSSPFHSCKKASGVDIAWLGNLAQSADSSQFCPRRKSMGPKSYM